VGVSCGPKGGVARRSGCCSAKLVVRAASRKRGASKVSSRSGKLRHATRMHTMNSQCIAHTQRWLAKFSAHRWRRLYREGMEARKVAVVCEMYSAKKVGQTSNSHATAGDPKAKAKAFPSEFSLVFPGFLSYSVLAICRISYQIADRPDSCLPMTFFVNWRQNSLIDALNLRRSKCPRKAVTN